MWKQTVKFVVAAMVCGGCCASSDCGAAEVIEEVVVVAPESKGAMSCAKAVKPADTAPNAKGKDAVTKPKSSEARKVGQQMVNSICKGDAKGFCGKLCADMKKKFSHDHFFKHHKQLYDKMGKPVKGEFLAELAHPVFNISVWKVTFLKEVPGKKPEERQALFQVVTGERNGQMQLLNFGFI
ncbi:MAG: hypothetical protein IKA87_03625 [Lentisphaeria bacterium]|nr:hypothetical protein [Lentisphaeria bacterium]